jgi:hypothetical protein
VLSSADVAWLALLPASLLFLAAAVWLAPSLSTVIQPGTDFFAFVDPLGNLNPEPIERMRFLLALLAAAGLAVAVLWLSQRVRHQTAPPWLGPAVLSIQAGGAALIGWAWIKQADATTVIPAALYPFDITYFSIGDLVVAGFVGSGLAILAVRGRLAAIRVRAAGLASRPLWRLLALLLAAGITAAWLLPAIVQDSTIGSTHRAAAYHNVITFDEYVAVLNDRSPLVDFVPLYSSILPYALAGPLSILGPSITTFAILMSLLSLASLLAIYLVFAQLTNRVAALGLYLPFLAISLFPILQQEGDGWFYPANHYPVFPIRYLGPYVVALLCALHLSGRAPRRPEIVLGVAALAVLNNVEFGLPCFGAALIALWLGGRRPGPDWGRLGQLALRGALGAIGALSLVSVLTLVRASSLPDLGLLTYWAELFGVAGFGNLPMPSLGFHTILYLTFAAALVLAAARKASGAPDTTLTGMLAYSGIFGLGAGAYYAGRSDPSVLIFLFSIWGLAVALLALSALRNLAEAERAGLSIRTLAPGLAALTALGLMATAATRFPLPWSQVDRIFREAPFLPQEAHISFVSAQTEPGERVAVLDTLGHRIAERAGVTSVFPYNDPGFAVLVSKEQMDYVLESLDREGEDGLFLGATTHPEIGRYLRRRGFRPVARDPSSRLTEWRPGLPRRRG